MSDLDAELADRFVGWMSPMDAGLRRRGRSAVREMLSPRSAPALCLTRSDRVCPIAWAAGADLGACGQSSTHYHEEIQQLEITCAITSDQNQGNSLTGRSARGVPLPRNCRPRKREQERKPEPAAAGGCPFPRSRKTASGSGEKGLKTARSRTPATQRSACRPTDSASRA